MTPTRRTVETILRNWNGRDDEAAKTPADVAGEIDEMYREYLAGLPAKTAAIKAGQDANDRRVA